MACGRLAGAGAAIVEAHRLGIPEGPHERLWTPAYHRDAAPIYAESLPPSYQSDIAALFRCSVEAMAGRLVPSELAEDWVIVTDYLVSARAAILESFAVPAVESSRISSGSTWEVEGRETPPMAVRFDELARLTTTRGASRLKQAAIAVRQYMEGAVPQSLDSIERHLLHRLAAGARIVDLAEELGHSERNMYRVLGRLWEHLGVSGRGEGLQRASDLGLLD